MSNWEELKSLAELAGGKEWQSRDERGYEVLQKGIPELSWIATTGTKMHMDFIAAASPKKILALIAENEALHQDADRYRWLRSRKVLDGINLQIQVADDDGNPVDIIARWDTADQLIDEDMTKGEIQ